MDKLNNEGESFLKGSTAKSNKSYDSIMVKNIDEESVVSSGSDSSTNTIDVHDTEYIIKHRLGDVSLPMITFWYDSFINTATKTGTHHTFFIAYV